MLCIQHRSCSGSDTTFLYSTFHRLLDFVLSDFSCQCVPVNVEYLRCLALVAAASGKRSLKELLLNFLQGFIETNFLLQHFNHESIQYFFHTTPLRSAQPQRFCSKWKWL